MIASANVQGRELGLDMTRTAAGKLSQEVTMGGQVVSKQVFNGETGFVMQMGQKMPYNEDQIKAAKTDADAFPELTVGDAKIEGIEQVDGKDAYVVSADETTKNYYAVDSGLKVQSVKTVSQGGQTMSIPTGYGDYQEVKGVKFPFTISQSMGPQSFEFKVSEIMVNEGVEDADFSVE